MTTGRIVREARTASEPEALVAFFRASGMEMERVGLEACSLTAWLHAALTEAGIPAICIEARQAKAAMGAMPNKTDRNDARGIAQIMRTGWYRAVHVKSPSCRSWRALLTARRMVINKRRDVENGIRALLREVGLKVGTPSRKDFPARVRELAAMTRCWPAWLNRCWPLSMTRGARGSPSACSTKCALEPTST